MGYGSTDLRLDISTEKKNLTSRFINLFNYFTNTLFYIDLFLTIINCYNQDFVKSAFFHRKVLFSERLFVLQNKIYYKSCR
jgi:hypothetical protein